MYPKIWGVLLSLEPHEEIINITKYFRMTLCESILKRPETPHECITSTFASPIVCYDWPGVHSTLRAYRPKPVPGLPPRFNDSISTLLPCWGHLPGPSRLTVQGSRTILAVLGKSSMPHFYSNTAFTRENLLAVTNRLLASYDVGSGEISGWSFPCCAYSIHLCSLPLVASY